jgi:hypothetical protein
MAKKLLSLKSVVRTRRSYKGVGLTKRQKAFQGLAMFGHEVLMSTPLSTSRVGFSRNPTGLLKSFRISVNPVGLSYRTLQESYGTYRIPVGPIGLSGRT